MYENRLFHDGVEVEIARENDAPGGGDGFAFGDGPIVSGWLLFQGQGFLENFFRKGLVGENLSIGTQILMKSSVYDGDFHHERSND